MVDTARAAEPSRAQRWVAEQPWVKMRVTARTPEQVAAFYEARGLPRSAIELLRRACYLTVGVLNKTGDILWLELNTWRAATPTGDVERLDRAYWNTAWTRLDVPQAKRATFGWTLLPEQRDLYPGESAAGNLVLAYADSPFTLQARFATKADRSGKEQVIEIADISCAPREAGP